MAGVLKHTMVVRHPDTLEATALLVGSEVPDWASDLVDEGNLESKAAAKAAKTEAPAGGSTSGDKGYAGQTPDELKTEAESRGLTVEGTGKDGNVLKGDLVAALEADDASKA